MEKVTGRLIFPCLKQLWLDFIFSASLSSLRTLSPSSCFLGQPLPKNTYSELQILLSIQFLWIKKIRKGMGEGLISPHTNSLHLLETDGGPTVGPVLLLHSQKQLYEDGNKKMLAEYCKWLLSLQEWEHASRAHTNKPDQQITQS